MPDDEMQQHEADSVEAWLPCIVCFSYFSLIFVGKVENVLTKSAFKQPWEKEMVLVLLDMMQPFC